MNVSPVVLPYRLVPSDASGPGFALPPAPVSPAACRRRHCSSARQNASFSWHDHVCAPCSKEHLDTHSCLCALPHASSRLSRTGAIFALVQANHRLHTGVPTLPLIPGLTPGSYAYSCQTGHFMCHDDDSGTWPIVEKLFLSALSPALSGVVFYGVFQLLEVPGSPSPSMMSLA